jgi:hypothetical protein
VRGNIQKKRKQRKSECRQKRSTHGRREKNEEGSVIRQHTLVETSMDNDGTYLICTQSVMILQQLLPVS